MTISSASPGQTLYVETEFRKQNGGVLNGTGLATYVVRNQDGLPVLSGTGTQDMTNPARWTATITIPASAPIPANGGKWSIQWRLPLKKSDAYREETFPIVPTGDESVAKRPTEILTLSATAFSDVIYLPASAQNVTLTIKDTNGQVKMQPTVGTPSPYEEGFKYTVDVAAGLPVSLTGSGYYLSVWQWTDNGEINNEVHTVYVLSPQGMGMVHNLRQAVDRAALKDIHTHLEFTDADLLHFILRGIAYCNGHGQITYWNLNNIPLGLESYIEMAAMLYAVRSQYLAEGMHAFDFQGLGVQLNVDRTQYLDNIANQMIGELEKLPDAKVQWIKAGEPTTAGKGKGKPIGSLNTSVFYRNLIYPVAGSNLYGNGILVGSVPSNGWMGRFAAWAYPAYG